MRQLLNVAYVAQVERIADDDEFDRWEAELNAEPGVKPGRPRRAVAEPDFLRHLPGGGVAA